jgi:citrate synthase
VRSRIFLLRTFFVEAYMEKKWVTSVARVEADEVYLRGFPLGSLIGKLSFSATTFLLIRGSIPTPNEARMMDALLCSVLDYGLKKPGTVAARFCVSGNPSMVAGLASAVLSVGEYTLAPDHAGHFIAETLAEAKLSGESLEASAESLIARIAEEKQRVPGFGHPSFRFLDPRAQTLKQIAQETGVWGEACDWYEAIHRAFIIRAGKPEIVINEVGMMAAILVQMGFAPHEMTGIAIMSSLPGVVAHISEELSSGIRIRTLPDSIIQTMVPDEDLGLSMKDAGWPP